jgi:gluconate 2-dehydrogenase gamma chain
LFGDALMTSLPEMERRSLLQSMALLLGVAALPVDAVAAARKSRGKPILSKDQFALLSAIADTIIPVTDTPGAIAVGVPKLLDAMLANWASPSRRLALIGAMSEIDSHALATDQKGFAALDPARRKMLLLDHDKAALKPGPPPKEKLNALMTMVAGPPVANPAYLKLKELIIALYYSSEVAMTQELVYEHVPGKFVPSMNITPETRPFAGVGGPF